MSWIAGLIRFNDTAVSPGDLQPLRDFFGQRPHDRLRCWHQDNAGLVSAIYEVTPEDVFDNQPLSGTDNRQHIVFDGRLDNRSTLIKQLGCDAEVAAEYPDSWFALRAYQKWGMECCHQLHGDYAFVIWDEGEQQLSLFRDPIGLRPLFYTRNENYFAFASHSAALKALPGVDTSLDEAWAADFLSLTHQRKERTACKDIQKLPAAHWLLLKATGPTKVERYWRLGDERRDAPRHADVQAYYDEFRDLLQTAVDVRLRGARPVASMLSGGLDSSAVTALSSAPLRAQGRPLIAVSSVLAEGHEGEETDERPYIEAVLKKYPEIIWRPVSVPDKDLFSELDELWAVCGQPSRDMFYFMTLALLRAGGEADARTVLSGFGGDFFASASLSGALLDMLMRGQVIRAMTTCLAEARQSEEHPIQLARRAFLNHLIAKLMRLARRVNRRSRVRKSLPPVLDGEFCERANLEAQLREFDRMMTPGFFSSRSLDEAILESGVMDEGLTSLSLMGKAAGLDVVLPLMDRRVVSYAINLPLHVRRHGGLRRSLLRNACHSLLPPEVAQRVSKGAFIPDQTRRLYATVAQVLPSYTKGEKQLPPWLNLAEIEKAAQGMRLSGSGFYQAVDPLVNVIAPLVLAEYLGQ